MLEAFNRWLEKVSGDLLDELRLIKGDESAINDRFYRSLKFGTGGLRGVIGAGTNRMNIHTVGLAAQGLAAWLGYKGSVAIAFDSRNKSYDFAKTTASVLAENGVTVHFFPELQPTPTLSFVVRELGCSAGVVITASHNPAIYNGFKCYGADGCQITDGAAREVEACITKLDIFNDVKRSDFNKLVSQGLIRFINDSLVKEYLNNVSSCQAESETVKKAGLRVIYTPLCGAGNKPVRKVLECIGCDVTVVSSQESPDGNFPRCPKPNPEIREAFDAALELADEMLKSGNPADILLATDPDCDRVGIAVKNEDASEGEKYILMTGNEVGALLLNYLLSRRKANGTLPENPIAIKTIVTTALADRICEEYGCELKICLTGFKYIGEIITGLQQEGLDNRFILGFEESYGYLAGTYARDKDAVVGSMLICEMAAYYKLQGKSLLHIMRELYDKHGYYVHLQSSFDFEGEEGMKRIASIMDSLRADEPSQIEGSQVVGFCDYLESNDLPPSNVIEFNCADGSILTARPSGTEPKIKFYLTAAMSTLELSRKRITELESFVKKYVN